MNHDEFNKCFTEAVEKDRVILGLTQKQMADALDLSLSTYKRMISGDCDKIDMYLSYKMYKISHRLAYELVGYTDTFLDTVTMLKALKVEELEIVNDLCKMLTLSRQYSERHLELMEAYMKLPKVEQRAVDRILMVSEEK